MHQHTRSASIERAGPARWCTPRAATSPPGTCWSPPTATRSGGALGAATDHPDRQLHHRHRAAGRRARRRRQPAAPDDERHPQLSPLLAPLTRRTPGFRWAHQLRARQRADRSRPAVCGDDRDVPAARGRAREPRVERQRRLHLRPAASPDPLSRGHHVRDGVLRQRGCAGRAGWERLPASGSPGVPNRPFPVSAFRGCRGYRGHPWFLPLVGVYYSLRDRL